MPLIIYILGRLDLLIIYILGRLDLLGDNHNIGQVTAHAH